MGCEPRLGGGKHIFVKGILLAEAEFILPSLSHS